jgi:outer membrane immunogenic protein
MKKLLGTVAILAAAMPFAARAADLPPAPPAYKAPVVAPMPAYNWTGLYIGASLGGEWESITGNFTNPGVFGPGNWAVSNSRGMWDGHIGAQYQWNMIVFGVEADYIGLFNNNNGGTSSCLPGCGTGFMSSQLHNNIWTLGGKLGAAFGPWMAYASGGYASTKIDNSFFNVNSVLIESTETSHNGAYAGAGIDWQAWSTPGGALVLGVEYRHYWFNNVAATPICATGIGTCAGIAGLANPADHWAIQAHSDTIEAKASWLFNWGGPVVARY